MITWPYKSGPQWIGVALLLSANLRLLAQLQPGTVLWTYDAGSSITAAPAIGPDGTIYVGTYNNDYWGPARITEDNGKLRIALGTKLNVPLDHWDGGVFTYTWVSENSPPGTISKATFDGNGLTRFARAAEDAGFSAIAFTG